MQAVRNIAAKRRESASAVGANLMGIASVFLLGAMVMGAEKSASLVKNALWLCASSVIPTVFPFMVISNLLALGKGGELIDKLFGGITSKIFGVDRSAAVAVLLGALCGFPIGASASVRLYEKGCISKSDLCRLMTFVNNPSAAFVIYSVGDGMLGSPEIGAVIYLGVMISAFIAGLFSRVLMNDAPSEVLRTGSPTLPVSQLIVTSVSGAIHGALNVCAYAAFFPATVGVISSLIEPFGIPHGLRASIFGIFELVSGVDTLANVSDRGFAVTAISAVCAWSGISVLMQIVSVCRSSLGNEELSFTPMVVSKLFQALLCPLIVNLLMTIL